MKIDVITLFPEMISQGISFGVLGAAIDKKIVTVNTVNPRAFTSDIHQTVDDRPFGGGDGMVLMAEPLSLAIESVIKETKTAKNTRALLVTTPQGKMLNHKMVIDLSQKDHLIIISGRYSGIDDRIQSEYCIEEISIGDYVLSGGELAALVIIDSVARQIPGVLGHHESASKDSFAEGLIEGPIYTRPRVWRGKEVPAVLLEGHHLKIEKWKRGADLLTTFCKRKDLFLQYLEAHEVDKEKIINELNFFLKNLKPEEHKLFHVQESSIQEILNELLSLLRT